MNRARRSPISYVGSYKIYISGFFLILAVAILFKNSDLTLLFSGLLKALQKPGDDYSPKQNLRNLDYVEICTNGTVKSLLSRSAPHLLLSKRRSNYLNVELGTLNISNIPIEVYSKKNKGCIKLPNIAKEVKEILDNNKFLMIGERHYDILALKDGVREGFRDSIGPDFFNSIIGFIPAKVMLFTENHRDYSDDAFTNVFAEYVTEIMLDRRLILAYTAALHALPWISIGEKDNAVGFLMNLMGYSTLAQWQEISEVKLHNTEQEILSKIREFKATNHGIIKDVYQTLAEDLVTYPPIPLMNLLLRFTTSVSQKIMKLNLTHEQESMLKEYNRLYTNVFELTFQNNKKPDDPLIGQAAYNSLAIKAPKLALTFRNSMWVEIIVKNIKKISTDKEKCPKTVIWIGLSHIPNVRERLLKHPEFQQLCGNKNEELNSPNFGL